MESIEIWMAALPNSLTYEGLKSIIIEKTGHVEIVGAEFKHLRGNLNYAFVQVRSLEDAIRVIDAMNRRNLFNIENMTVRLSRSVEEYTNQRRNSRNLEGTRGVEKSLRNVSRKERRYRDRKSEWREVSADNLNDGWAHISHSNSNSNSNLDSTSRPPIPSRPESYRSPPPHFSASPSTSQHNPRSNSADHSDLVNAFQDPPPFPYSHEELDLWVEHSWQGRLPFDYGIRKELGYFGKVRKIIPPNWRM